MKIFAARAGARGVGGAERTTPRAAGLYDFFEMLNVRLEKHCLRKIGARVLLLMNAASNTILRKTILWRYTDVS